MQPQLSVLNKRFKIFLNYIVGPVLFVWLSISIYKQVQQQTDVHQSWELIMNAFHGPQSFKLILVILLLFVNLGMEARKWQVLISGIEPISFAKAFRAILAGQALAFNTINRAGEPAGKALFLHEGNRIRGIVVSVIGSMSQIIVNFLIGLMGLLYMRHYLLNETSYLKGLSGIWLDGLMIAISIVICIVILLYFRISLLIQLLEKIPFIAKYKFFVEKLEDFHWKELTRILILSLSRYVVYVAQYVLLLQVFVLNTSWIDAAAMTTVMLLILSIVPTIALAELGFRGKVGIQLFGMISANTLGIVATTAGIWIINLVIPAIAGTLFIIGIKLFRNK